MKHGIIAVVPHHTENDSRRESRFCCGKSTCFAQNDKSYVGFCPGEWPAAPWRTQNGTYQNHRNGVVAIVLTLLMSIVLSACQVISSGSAAGGASIFASGNIEAETVDITAEVGGRIVEITANEGDEVEAGQILVRLDQTLLLAQIRQAEVAVQTAEANLAQVKAGARAEEIAAAEAAWAQAVAERDGAKKAWEDAKALRDTPQELELQIEEARTRLALAERQVEMARAKIAEAEAMRDQYRYDGSDEGKTRYRIYDKQVEAAREELLVAEATAKGAQQALQALLDMRDDPRELTAQVNAAKAAYETAEAAVEVARATLDELRAGPTLEQIAVAEAQVRQAEAALAVLQVQLEKTTLKAPISGLVTSKAVHVGEMARPGATLMTLASLDEVKLVVYIPEAQIGLVHIGQPVEVTVDSYPGRIFPGQVVYISSRAEFTPRNVQTREERVKTVFAVKVRVPNPGHELKPGMPADASISTGKR